MNPIRKTVASVAVAGTLIGGGMLAPASAQPVDQDGLVNVNVGDITILEDVQVGVAANIVAQICGVKVGPVVVLGRAVDRGGDDSTVCTVDDIEAPVTLTQNTGA